MGHSVPRRCLRGDAPDIVEGEKHASALVQQIESMNGSAQQTNTNATTSDFCG